MDVDLPAVSPHPSGEQPSVEEWRASADTFAGRVHVEWDGGGRVTGLGQLPFFIDYLKQAGLFAGWVADCSARLQQSQCPLQARRAGHGAAVGVVGALPLRPHHELALRPGEPGAARHEEGGERGRGAARPGQDRRGRRTGLAGAASRLLRAAAAGRAVGARYRQHDQGCSMAARRAR